MTSGLKIGVFLHGTAIMHAAAATVAREKRVVQVREREPSVREFASYVPTPGTVQKLAKWSAREASFVYISSHRHREHLAADEQVLRRYEFPLGPVHGRAEEESYGQLVERLNPDILIEDDCESIGGTAQTVASQLSPAARRRIRCLVLPEFIGLGRLPDDLAELVRFTAGR